MYKINGLSISHPSMFNIFQYLKDVDFLKFMPIFPGRKKEIEFGLLVGLVKTSVSYKIAVGSSIA